MIPLLLKLMRSWIRVLLVIFFARLVLVTNDSWIIDTSATDHMTPNLSLLANTSTFSHDEHMNLPIGTMASINTIGNVKLSSKIC